jgi:hypothetical protein
MSALFATTLRMIAFLVIARQPIFEARPFDRAIQARERENIAQPEPVVARQVVVWEFRLENATCSFDAFCDGRRCVPPRSEREWIATWAVDTYIARSDDPTAQGYSEYGVCGPGAAHFVHIFRFRQRVFRLFFSEPMERR